MAKKIYKAGAFLIVEDTVNGTLFELNSSDVQIKKENANVDVYNIINSDGQSVLKVNLSEIVDANGDAYIENDWNTFRFEQVGAKNTTDVSAVKPKVYKALLTQTGTSAPTAVVLENTIGNIVWTIEGTGNYLGTLSGAFVSQNNTYIIVNQNYDSVNAITYSYYNNANSVSIETINIATGANVNNTLSSTSILIEVYP